MKNVKVTWPTLLIIAASTFITFKSPVAETPGNAASIEVIIQKLEEDWAKALLNRDYATLRRIMAPDYVESSPDGQIQTRAEIMADIENGVIKFEAFKNNELKVRVYSNTAV